MFWSFSVHSCHAAVALALLRQTAKYFKPRQEFLMSALKIFINGNKNNVKAVWHIQICRLLTQTNTSADALSLSPNYKLPLLRIFNSFHVGQRHRYDNWCILILLSLGLKCPHGKLEAYNLGDALRNVVPQWCPTFPWWELLLLGVWAVQQWKSFSSWNKTFLFVQISCRIAKTSGSQREASSH